MQSKLEIWKIPGVWNVFWDAEDAESLYWIAFEDLTVLEGGGSVLCIEPVWDYRDQEFVFRSSATK